jgi:hypothetical protein
MPRRELLLQKDIVDAIRLSGGLARLCVQTPYTVTGDPDIYGVFNGRMFQMEVKEEGEEPTDIQQLRLAQWKSAGAKTVVVYSEEEALKFLRKIK